jgi:DNA-binding MarR family transcriptional regulator
LSAEFAGGYELTILLSLAFRALTDELHLQLARLGFDDVRPTHGYIFQLLSFGAANVNEVAAHLGVTKQAASQLIDYLEQHHYLTRQPDPGDKRGKLVVLTARGWECIRQTERIFSELEAQWTARLGTERMEALRADLRKLVLEANGGNMPHLLRPV